MLSRMDEFARQVTLEMGKRFEEAQAEVMLSADIIAYYAKHAQEFLADEIHKPEPGAPGRKKVWHMGRTKDPASYQPSPTGWDSRRPTMRGLKARFKTPPVEQTPG